MKKKYILIIIALFSTLSLITSCNSGKNKIKAQIEDCIEKGDFNKARQLNKKLEYGGMTNKICRAQVASLIDEGQFNIAADIAKEDMNYGVYYVSLMGKLVSLYDTNPQGLMLALSSINFPTSSCEWDDDLYRFSYTSEFNDLYQSFNDNIKHLMLYAKSNNDMDYMKKLSFYLKPLYRGKEVRKPDKSYVSGYKEYTEWEKTPTDYTQANQIKKELGIK